MLSGNSLVQEQPKVFNVLALYDRSLFPNISLLQTKLKILFSLIFGLSGEIATDRDQWSAVITRLTSDEGRRRR